MAVKGAQAIYVNASRKARGMANFFRETIKALTRTCSRGLAVSRLSEIIGGARRTRIAFKVIRSVKGRGRIKTYGIEGHFIGQRKELGEQKGGTREGIKRQQKEVDVRRTS